MPKRLQFLTPCIQIRLFLRNYAMRCFTSYTAKLLLQITNLIKQVSQSAFIVEIPHKTIHAANYHLYGSRFIVSQHYRHQDRVLLNTVYHVIHTDLSSDPINWNVACFCKFMCKYVNLNSFGLLFIVQAYKHKHIAHRSLFTQ